ncbi:MAG: alginate lyase family protein [Planctomycetaceae bacterium]|nr:alginate lyase family protein [Planctomycetaceae bacterium]
MAGLTRRARIAVKAVAAMGLRRTALRVRHELIERSGWLARRYPPGELARWIPAPDELPRLRAQCARGLFAQSEPAALTHEYRQLFPDIGPALTAEADRLAAGEMQYFSRLWAPFDPRADWFRNPFTGQVVDGRAHWTHVSWDAPSSGDLKYQLEPARFAWVFKLARAYRYTADEKYAAAFWRLFDGWCAQNPPQAGPLWICGQESALRLLAMVFGLYEFAASPESHDDRFGRLVGMIAAHADRILGTTVYARSQQNNHALSEGVGLFTAGLVLQEFSAAARWRSAGRAIVEEQVPLQIYDDGGYTQHSHNYHRVMLNVLTWGVRIGEQLGEPLAPLVSRRLGLAANFLREMLDPLTGQVPNYGPNDGALILPLSVAPYEDYRPAVQAAGWAATKTLALGPGDWNEDLLWLAGVEVARRAQTPAAATPPPNASLPPPASAHFATAGYDVLRGRESWGMIRAARYRDRPNQADQLHLDLWWRGINIACDSGAYLYNGTPPWQNALAVTAVHNTVGVDDQDQMTRAGRFLWLDWAQAQGNAIRSPRGSLELWRGGHTGYRRLDPRLEHHREVLRLGDQHWLVLDALAGDQPHRYRLHWLLADFPHRWDEALGALRLDTPAGPYLVRCGLAEGTPEYSLVTGDAHSTRGWRSRYYGNREPALSLAAVTNGQGARFWTLLGPADLELSCAAAGFRVAGAQWQAEIQLTAAQDFRIASVRWQDAAGEDRLEAPRD